MTKIQLKNEAIFQTGEQYNKKTDQANTINMQTWQTISKQADINLWKAYASLMHNVNRKKQKQI